MLDHTLEEHLIAALQEQHALEQQGLRRVQALLPTLGDDALAQDLRRLAAETEEHVELLAGCLSANGESPDDAGGAGGAPGGSTGRALRDIYVAAHASIAGYQLLERLAERAEDEETAEVARAVRDEEVATVALLDRHWDAVVDRTLADRGTRAAA